ncbi:MAG TPA: YqgE/AlgH family protein [Flavobacteriales bacterium]|nr:YqgE/AlgH family protein [Flavobacteriales bacterium]
MSIKKIDDLFDFNKLNRLKPKKGRLLVSEPFLDDDHFGRSVILIGEHNEEGTFGFVLNHYVEQIDLNDIMNDFPHFETRIANGGPVKTNNLYYIHTLGDLLPGSIPLLEGVYMGGNFDTLKMLIEKQNLTKKQVRFFLGYAGWAFGQLENEIKENSWIIANGAAGEIMDTEHENLWESILKQMGEKHKIISNFPENPSLN